MSDYTPTTEEVRNQYSGFSTSNSNHTGQVYLNFAEFDRWLAEVKAQEREDCVNHVKFLYCSHSMEHKPYQEAVDDIVEVLTGKEDGSEVFEKWLAEVKAQAWQEGWDTKPPYQKINNPYRQGEEQ